MAVNRRIPKAHAEKLRPAWTAFGDVVGSISSLLVARPDGEALEICALDGDLIGRIELADVRRKFEGIAWSLTTRRTRNGGGGAITSAYGRGRGPAAWNAARAAFHVESFAGYAALGPEGLGYLALHETAHVTRLGLGVEAACWRNYLKGKGKPGGYPGSPWYLYNERVANEIARVLGARIGVATLAAPTYGSPPVRLRLGLKRA